MRVMSRVREVPSLVVDLSKCQVSWELSQMEQDQMSIDPIGSALKYWSSVSLLFVFSTVSLLFLLCWSSHCWSFLYWSSVNPLLGLCQPLLSVLCHSFVSLLSSVGLLLVFCMSFVSLLYVFCRSSFSLLMVIYWTSVLTDRFLQSSTLKTSKSSKLINCS